MVHVRCPTCGLVVALKAAEDAARSLCRRCLASLKTASEAVPERRPLGSTTEAPRRAQAFPATSTPSPEAVEPARRAPASPEARAIPVPAPPTQTSAPVGDWSSVHAGLKGLRNLLFFVLLSAAALPVLALVWGVVVIVLIAPYGSGRTPMPAPIRWLEDPTRILALVLLVLMAVLAVQLFRFTRAPGAALRRPAWLSFGTWLAHGILVATASILAGSPSYPGVAWVLGWVSGLGIIHFFRVLARTAHAKRSALPSLLLLMSPMLLAPLLQARGDIVLLTGVSLLSFAGVAWFLFDVMMLAQTLPPST
ncbi:hypothetical protein HG543_50795, partial [Pyxidicoccus fallax]|nr:hypothetical protein [Pyxidicoccus fallax]